MLGREHCLRSKLFLPGSFDWSSTTATWTTTPRSTLCCLRGCPRGLGPVPAPSLTLRRRRVARQAMPCSNRLIVGHEPARQTPQRASTLSQMSSWLKFLDTLTYSHCVDCLELASCFGRSATIVYFTSAWTFSPIGKRSTTVLSRHFRSGALRWKSSISPGVALVDTSLRRPSLGSWS